MSVYGRSSDVLSLPENEKPFCKLSPVELDLEDVIKLKLNFLYGTALCDVIWFWNTSDYSTQNLLK